MTNQEAIKIIQMERDHCASHNQDIGKSDEYHKEMQSLVNAFDLAIKALEERPQGEWITFPTNCLMMQCPECTALLSRTRSDIFKDSIGEMNFCPNCGADMRGGAE